jgi:hypothetical protein
MPPIRKPGFLRLLTCGVLVILSSGASAVLAEDQTAEPATVSTAAEVKVYEATVTVGSTIKCRKYEGRVLFCTLSPLRDVRKALETKLVLGFASIDIGGEVYEVEPDEAGAIRFYPRGEKGRKDYSGEQQLKIQVIHVK